MVANVNLDMPILTYGFADVIAFGADHSDMKNSVAKAAEKIGLELSPDPMPYQAQRSSWNEGDFFGDNFSK